MGGHYSIDARGFWYACKVLCVCLVLVTATKYGIVRASERIANEAASDAAAAAANTEVPKPALREYRDVPLPSIAAEAYLIAEIEDAVIASRNADTPLPIASITKLVTALVARDIPPESLITITADDRSRTEGTPGRLPAGTTYRAGDLLYPLLMESNNSAAFALARSHTGFIERMNQEASTLGMRSTTFVEPSGLSPENRASARDLLMLVRHLMGERDDLMDITATPSRSITSAKGRRFDVPNFNVFISDPAFLGGKTGYTDDASQTMAAVFEHGERQYGIIVLGTKDRKKDIEALRHWLEAATP
jgi:D-alanyl-D-alanine endopeptidase (penicillin-binding protein 7)